MTTILRFIRSLGVLSVVAAPAAPAQEAGAATVAKACADQEHRQFDFWIGDWDVTTPAGAAAGRNEIEPILGGCALKESWTGARGMSGSSYNAYDRRKGQWHQTWVDDNGSVLQLDGRFADGKMVLSGETRDTAGARVINRITWNEIEPGVVRQLWETSGDGGKSWSVAFDGRYRKRS